jgi:hypothetical protein
MSYMQPGRFTKTMHKSAALVAERLAKVSQEAATSHRDGPDGWTALEAMCHLRDFNEIFFNRAMLAVHQDHPPLAAVDHEALVSEKAYNQQDLKQVVADYLAMREKFIGWLAELPESAWSRTAEHPEAGTISLYEMAMQAVFHDVDHLEQMGRILAAS